MIVARLRPLVPLDEQSRLTSAWRHDGHRSFHCRAGRHTLVTFPDLAPASPDGEEFMAVLRASAAVEAVVDSAQSPPLSSFAATGEPSAVRVGDRSVGGGSFTWIAGPCAVESADQLMTVARDVRARGAHLLRGGAFKPRTSPYAFQGLGTDGLALLRDAAAATGLGVVTEVVDAAHVEAVAEVADVLQIGTRNAQNFPLLREVALTGRPVLLKRGFGCTVKEWLHSAEYLLAAGNGNVLLCERGVRTFEDASRFTLDITAVPLLKRLSHLPVIVDPSHACGHADLVAPLAAAAAVAGADGVMVDVDEEGRTALCDGKQAITPDAFGALVARTARILHSAEPVEPVAERAMVSR
ncbi:3-deoxy-7-phosphoheptulonate synthase [Streptomyces spectabilis]|uniref:3-deoxy-7-phosphoheptulonate synthase n=2 Tax=Streptomyces spectabilis TaxID=68270 RepID=A0A7W8EX26_STRST|nr:3-deoxy-7-phosphoheptulonate synthase [Streptomyces spectabilis]MBB5106903.1 3-deoxy-7-phosphoheptulonate synthase [Streptomyces spectabilis]MCI3906367.1 3-deoxy-7-phosphoheptulonate synthase [Streptomyces spectabilis]GGV41108.1 3-deoxy-7-phosphoheptulonate synthase [Streptomyces spectabilis]